MKNKKISFEEENALKKKLKDELDRLNKILLDSNTIKLIEKFKSKFQICEILYKLILEKYNIDHGKEGGRDKLKLNVNQVKPALKYVNFSLESDIINRLFGSESHAGKRSIKKIRDILTHNLTNSAIDELKNRKNEIFNDMDYFLKMIESA